MHRRIIFAVILSMVIILVSLGVLSYVSVEDSINRSMESRLALADILGKHIDYILENNITRLYDISLASRIDFHDGDWEPEKRALKAAYEYSIFTDGVYLLDKGGNVVASYPHRDGIQVNLLSIPHVGKTLSERKPVISDVFTIERTKRKVIFVLVPLKDGNGEVVGAAAGEINPADYVFSRVMKAIPEETDMNLELVDGQGIVIASNDSKRILTSSDHNHFLSSLIARKKSSVNTCHRCHAEGRQEMRQRTRDVLAFAPLATAPWGVAIREAEERVFQPTAMLKKGFFAMILISVLTAFLLWVGLSRSIVKPIHALSEAAQRIGKGNLAEPVTVRSSDEIGTLARSFEDMRTKLLSSLDSITKHAADLEDRVAARTQDLQESREKLSLLLLKVISAQEEERKRIARELHDETSQALNAILISLDTLSLSLSGNLEMSGDIRRVREYCTSTLHGLHQMIKDLRPPVLDDLGLESAIRWVMDRHLGEKGVNCHFRLQGSCNLRDEDLGIFNCREIELILFRVIQEAVINISKYAHAENVCLSLIFRGSYIEVEIEDDGVGFDARKVLSALDSGFGLIGMKERISLLDGRLTICSTPGGGTQISAYVPV